MSDVFSPLKNNYVYPAEILTVKILTNQNTAFNS